MTADLLPLRALLLTFAGFVRREQARMIEYLVEENQILRELHGDRRLRLRANQRDQRSRNLLTHFGRSAA